VFGQVHGITFIPSSSAADSARFMYTTPSATFSAFPSPGSNFENSPMPTPSVSGSPGAGGSPAPSPQGGGASAVGVAAAIASLALATVALTACRVD